MRQTSLTTTVTAVIPGLAMLAGLLTTPSCATTPSAEEQALLDEASPAKRTEEKLRAALHGEHRSKREKARGRYRNPLLSMTFFGLADTMTVIEIWPGYGWYTDIMAPVLRDTGKLFITSADPNGDPQSAQTKQAKDFLERKQKYPNAYAKVEAVIIQPPDQLTFGPPGSADMVLTFRNMHGWIEGGYADKVFAAAFKVLKPGGVLGIEDHRAAPGKTDAKTGYIAEADAIKLVEAAGFKLTGKSELNANAKDTKDHPDGVWSLPPTLSGGEVDKAKYLAIGESDRFTLRFEKPAQ